MSEIVPIFIIGPTGVGKSDLAYRLAKKYQGQIVNCDSMQQYQGMDIGTAKVSPTIRNSIPHHLLDNLQVTETASLEKYLSAARRIIDALLNQNIMPIIVGGSMLYYQALVDGWEIPAANPVLRTELEKIASTKGINFLYERLCSLDPTAAKKIIATDERRIIRALEVIELTGTPYQASQPAKSTSPAWNALIIGLTLDLTILDTKLAARTENMFAQGFVEEVEGLLEKGITSGLTAKKAIGYAQILAYLEGNISLNQAKMETYRFTKRYVRRQRSWFLRDPRINWLTATSSKLLNEVEAIIDSYY